MARYGNDNDKGRPRGKNGDRVSARDKLMPALFDRLTDYEPQNKRESERSKTISHNELRKIILRDLQWLFNCNNNESLIDVQAFPAVRRSTVNYGITPLAGKRMSDIEWSDIQKNLRMAILTFEPRIIPEELKLRCVSESDDLDSHNVLSIEIRGLLWCNPHPLEFCFRSDIDLENGYFNLRDIG
ncbi:type VI secretion system baseplate subunit TssE [Enterobacillus tribolii]|uniref:Type VI secretion system protein ImpF n=1 Tax=Enterobacillus tribolii TaxID=1487935 RepID=A0A370QS63_9GAMM|nr:type VI secretion system baseplate subunit TssE [Enterobacillus tribolii]MBW7983738.1 type VI secretion system baseplate subunit TssE [Enterobacillus tribolii]RDK92102.1 type VI secretion system protein ImpF [Enterobacillus tribolii]